MTSVPPEQETFERNAIWVMYGALKAVRDEGYADWQTLTSFIANVLIDQDNPLGMLKRLREDVGLKLTVMRQQRRETAH